jgi:hypothetical protein
MITKNEELIVKLTFSIGTVAIAIYDFKTGVSLDSVLSFLKDFAPLFISFWIFIIVESMRNDKSHDKAAKRALEKISLKYGDYLKQLKDKDNDLYVATKDTEQAPFISYKMLSECFLEVRISYRTLKNFGYPIGPKDADKETKLNNVRQLVKKEAFQYLDAKGIRFKDGKNIQSEDIAFQIEFINPAGYEQTIVETVETIIAVLKSRRED